MGANSNRILMAILTGVVIVWTVRFFTVDSHSFLFHEQVPGVDFPIIGSLEGGGPELAPALPDSVCHLLAEADVALGQQIATAQCAACHQFVNEAHGQGPHLVGLIGRAKADTDFGSYSSALRNFGGAWDQETLNAFLFKPSGYVPGTAMSFAGWDNSRTQQRANVIAYLYDVSGAVLPDCPGAEEAAAPEVLDPEVLDPIADDEAALDGPEGDPSDPS